MSKAVKHYEAGLQQSGKAVQSTRLSGFNLQFKDRNVSLLGAGGLNNGLETNFKFPNKKKTTTKNKW